MTDLTSISEQEIEGYTIEELLACPREELSELNDARLAMTSSAVVAHMLERIPVDDRRTVLRHYPEDAASDIPR